MNAGRDGQTGSPSRMSPSHRGVAGLPAGDLESRELTAAPMDSRRWKKGIKETKPGPPNDLIRI